jgi:hypothetical protein
MAHPSQHARGEIAMSRVVSERSPSTMKSGDIGTLGGIVENARLQ